MMRDMRESAELFMFHSETEVLLTFSSETNCTRKNFTETIHLSKEQIISETKLETLVKELETCSEEREEVEEDQKEAAHDCTTAADHFSQKLECDLTDNIH